MAAHTMMSTRKTTTTVTTVRNTGEGFASMTRELPKFAITLLCELDKLKFVVAASRYVCREDRPDPGLEQLGLCYRILTRAGSLHGKFFRTGEFLPSGTSRVA